MKYIFTITFILALFFNSIAQRVVPFKAILDTKEGKVKGILQKIDSSSIILDVKGKFVRVDLDQIETVKIRKLKNAYRYKTYVKDTEDEPTVYRMNANGDMVDHFGNKEPTLAQQIAAPFWFAAVNGVFNVLAFPIHAINPNVAKFKINGQPDSTKHAQISYYSINYQLKPNLLAELRRLKEISSKSKPNKK